MIKRRGWNEGSTAVETAFCFSALVALIFGIIEFGIALYNQNTMQLVVQEAGRYAMVNYAGDSSTACATDKMTVANYAKTVILARYAVIGTLPTSPISASCSGSSPVLMTIMGTYTTLNIMVTVPTFTTQITVPLS